MPDETPKIQRYDINLTIDALYEADLEEILSPDGEWVRWSDLAALFPEDDALFLRQIADEFRQYGRSHRAGHLEEVAAKIEALLAP